MTAVRLALLELRRFRGQPIRYLALAALILVPLLYGSLYLWSNWDPYGKMDQVPVAVVNQDSGATVAGKQLDAGSEFVDQLKATPTLDWNFVSADDAATGMRDGDYYFAIVVPPDFSSKLASLSGADPQKAHIKVELDDANGYIAGVMAKTMEIELQNQINTAVYVTFAKTMFGNLTELDDGLNEASDAASQLADGATAANDGAGDLASGLEVLDTGAEQVSDGVNRINGAFQTAGGHFADSWPTIQTGSQGAADLTSGISGRLDDIYSALCVGDAADTAACADLEAAATDTEQINDAVTSVNTDIQSVNGDDISSAAEQIDQLAKGAQDVSDGIGEAQTGAEQLQDGTQKLADGAQDLSDALNSAAAQVPAMDPDENAAAADVLGSPVSIKETNAHPAHVYGKGLAPFFFAIALWVFGLVAYLLLRSSNPRAMAGKAGAFTVAAAGWLPALFLGILGALLLYLVVDIGLGLDPVNALGTLGMCVLGIAVFSAIAHFLRLAFDAVGDVLILVLLMLQLTSAGGLYPMETTPVFFQAIHPYLPMTYLVEGLRVTISGGNTAYLWRAVVVLVGFGVAALLASTFVAMRHKRWTMARLHPAIEF